MDAGHNGSFRGRWKRNNQLTSLLGCQAGLEWGKNGGNLLHPVDGWNPAPVEVGSLSHYLQGLAPSQVVVWDFSHQQSQKTSWEFCVQKLVRICCHELSSNSHSAPYHVRMVKAIQKHVLKRKEAKVVAEIENCLVLTMNAARLLCVWDILHKDDVGLSYLISASMLHFYI